MYIEKVLAAERTCAPTSHTECFCEPAVRESTSAHFPTHFAAKSATFLNLSCGKGVGGLTGEGRGCKNHDRANKRREYARTSEAI